MAFDVLAVTLSTVVLASVIVMLLVALAGLVDPTTVVRCHDCARWMINTRHRPEAVCWRCRHSHPHHAGIPISRP